MALVEFKRFSISALSLSLVLKSWAIASPSLSRTPRGPFYGYALSTRVTENLFPWSATGNCEAGAVYNISRVEDISKHYSEIECMFHAGFAPSKVPEGVLYGKPLGGLNTRLFTPWLPTVIWQGKYIMKITCQGNPTYVSFNNILGFFPLGPAVDYIGPINETHAPGEHNSGKDALIIDYTADFPSICPNYLDYLKNNRDSMPIRRHLNSLYPLNIIYDCARIVGRQADGGLIFLGKTMIRDYFRDDKQAVTLFWYSLVSYNPDVNPEFKHGQALEPLGRDFTFTFPGIIGAAQVALPIDNFFSQPFKTIRKVGGILNNWSRNSIKYIREFITSFPTLAHDARLVNQLWANGRS